MKSLLVSFFLFATLISFSQEIEEIDLKVHKINGKEYYIHIVEQGNTLYAISRKYAIPIEKLKSENPRLTQELTIGDRLLIPLDEVKRRDLETSPEINGNFLIHDVQKKNTLFSIAKEYNVEINDIIAVNPEVEEGLKKGMKLKIPVSQIKSNASEAEYIKPAAVSPYQTHFVLPKETLYSLSKLYKVSIDSLLMVNNDLVGGLKVNQLINIPILKDYIDTNVVQVAFDSSAIKKTYKVVLMLPFYLNLMEEANDSSYTSEKRLNKELHHKAQYGIDFYQGFKFAIDSLVKQGLSLELVVLDTENDSSKVSNLLLNDTSLKSADLIVGPFYLSNFLIVADFAKQHQINIVSPVKLSNKILLGNNYVSKVATSDPIQLRFMGSYMYQELRNENLIIVYPDQFKDRRRAQILKKEYYDMAQLDLDSNRISSIKEVFWDPAKYYELKSKFDTARVNYLIVPSDDQSFVTRLMTKLYLEKDYEFKIFGIEEWENYDNIDIDYLQKLNVHLTVSEFIDINNKSLQLVSKKFISTYKLPPTKFTYLGFDVAYYYLSLLKDYGANYNVMLSRTKQEHLCHKFNFMKTGIESGFENHSTYLLRYIDFKRERVY